MQEGLDVSNFNVLALFWGLVSAASICVYTLQPIELLKKYGTSTIVGFAMFICGILSLAMFQQVESEALWVADLVRIICYHHTWYGRIL